MNSFENPYKYPSTYDDQAIQPEQDLLPQRPIESQESNSSQEPNSSQESAASQHSIEILSAATLEQLTFEPDIYLRQNLNEKGVESINETLRSVGSIVIEHITSMQSQHADALTDYLTRLPELMNRGALAAFASSPLAGGYFGGWKDDEAGSTTFNPEALDIQRWSRFAMWGNAGLNGMDDREIPVNDQSALLNGYLAAQMAQGHFGKEFRHIDAFETLQILADVEATTPENLATVYVPIFTQLRTNSANSQDQHRLDDALQKLAITWSSSQNTYIASPLSKQELSKQELSKQELSKQE